MSIIIVPEGKPAIRLDKSSFEKEASLQEFIRANPESLPIYDIKENIRLLIVAREFPTNSGPIDAIGIDADGDIYLIETKLYKNTDKRFVVAQVLDYGASLSEYSRDIQKFLFLIEEQIKSHFSQSLIEKFKDYFALKDEEEFNELKENIKLNFRNGSFKFVVLMDYIDDRLKDLILFINESSEFSIFAVQFDYYKHEQFEIVIPKIVGVEADRKKESPSSASKRKKITEEEFLADLNLKMKEEADLKKFMTLFEFGKSCSDSVRYANPDDLTFLPFNKKTSQRNLFLLFSGDKQQFAILLSRKKVELKTKLYLEGIDKIIERYSWQNLTWQNPDKPEEIYMDIPFKIWSPVVDELIAELDKLIVKN